MSYNLETFKMFATMMRDKFIDDDFLIGKIFFELLLLDMLFVPFSCLYDILV